MPQSGKNEMKIIGIKPKIDDYEKELRKRTRFAHNQKLKKSLKIK